MPLIALHFTPQMAPGANENALLLPWGNIWSRSYCQLRGIWTTRATWWHHQMETFSELLAICAGNSPVPGEFPAQRPVTQSFDVFFDLHLNKRLSKQSWGWWFEMPLCSLWRHCNESLGWYPMSDFFPHNCHPVRRIHQVFITQEVSNTLSGNDNILTNLINDEIRCITMYVICVG